jgi:hypothetical protein
MVPEERGRSAIAERLIPSAGERFVFDCWHYKRKGAKRRLQIETGAPWFSRMSVDELILVS